MQNFGWNLIIILIIIILVKQFLNLKNHLLTILLCLEIIILILFLNLGLTVFKDGGVIIIIYYITIAVCEGGIGLRFLVLLIRSHGNDYVYSIQIL